MMMSSMTSNEVMLRSIHQIRDHSLIIVWEGGGRGKNCEGDHMVLRGKGNGGREGKSTPTEHKQRIDCQLTLSEGRS